MTLSGSTLPLFDQQLATQRRDEGMALAALSREELLVRVRRAMVTLAHFRADRSVTADDAQRWLVNHGLDSRVLGNAAGSLFKTPDWAFTGQWVPSERVSSHSRYVRVWRLEVAR